MATPAQRLQVERLSYPAMQPREIIVWRNWLKENEPRFSRYEYNIRLGGGLDPGPSFTPERSEERRVGKECRL